MIAGRVSSARISTKSTALSFVLRSAAAVTVVSIRRYRQYSDPCQCAPCCGTCHLRLQCKLRTTARINLDLQPRLLCANGTVILIQIADTHTKLPNCTGNLKSICRRSVTAVAASSSKLRSTGNPSIPAAINTC